MRLIDANKMKLSESDDLSWSPNDINEWVAEQETINPQQELLKALDERMREIAEEDFFEASLLARSLSTVKAVIEEELKKYE